MKAHYPQHAVLVSLLKKGQYEACRATTEEMIAELMETPEEGFLPVEDQSAQGMLKGLRDRDRQLACLHIILCVAHFGLKRFREAAEKADIAAFLGRKVHDQDVVVEALYRSGVCYSSNGEYPPAAQRLTECLGAGLDRLRGDALYNRGFAYHVMGAYGYAVPDYEAAILWAADRDEDLVRRSRINLAWVLILSNEFARAEELLSALGTAKGADEDRWLQLHIEHDLSHIRHLQGNGREALKHVHRALRQAAKDYPHVRARVALTLMGVASQQGMLQEAFSLGVFAKRLAGHASRVDLDDEASRRMRELECQEGSEHLAQSLQQLGQLLPGSVARRKGPKYNLDTTGGVG